MNLRASCNFFFAIFLLNILVGFTDAQVKNTISTNGRNTTLPQVTIPQGTLQGIILATRYKRSISAFLGIPYGQPPIGNLRFNSPVMASGWNGTLDASVEGNPCPQLGNIGAEDCLYLNVYTPQLPKRNESTQVPVMVFIHGGAFESGNSSPSIYGPGYLLDANVLLVTFNYRLGPLGFLSTGDEVASGNWGLKDQVLALQWVQDNIAYFGGDPDQVTLFGQSAGGASVQYLTLSNSTIGLFHKYISQSGAAYGNLVYHSRSFCTNLSLQLGEILGCPTNTSSLLIDCLRQRDASEIINTRSQLFAWNGYPLIMWNPTDEPDVEGAILTDTPTNLIASGKTRDLPSMTGIVRDEGIIVAPGHPDSDTFEEFLHRFDDLLPIVLQYTDEIEDEPNFTAALKKFYFNNDLTINRTQIWSNCIELLSDAYIIYPVYRALKEHFALKKKDSFFYSFEYRGTFSRADQRYMNVVAHSDELLYLFPQVERLFGAKPGDMSEDDTRMIDTMVQLWTSFAINGTPTTSMMIGNLTWLPYSSEDNYLRIGNGSDVILEVRYNFLHERMQFWNELIATTSGNATTVSECLSLIFAILILYPNIRSLATRTVIRY